MLRNDSFSLLVISINVAGKFSFQHILKKENKSLHIVGVFTTACSSASNYLNLEMNGN